MRYFFLVCWALMVYTGFAVRAEAAVVSLVSPTDTVRVGDEVRVSVLIDTEKQTINACELSFEFPNEALDYVSSDDSRSVLSLWLLSPHQQTDNTIRLSGITPGGFMQDEASLVTVVFKVIQTGSILLALRETTCLLNDGSGTAASLTTESLVLTAAEGVARVESRPTDDELPEMFTPILVLDTDVYDGAPTIVFVTTDKGSGMDHYEIKEGWFDSYHTAQSPYKMRYPSFVQKVSLKAVDHAGNERIIEFYPQNLSLWYQQEKTVGGIFIGCVLVLSLLFIVLRKLFR